MELNQRILSDLIVHMKYARYIPELQRRELWPEICARYARMMCDKYPALAQEIGANIQFVFAHQEQQQIQRPAENVKLYAKIHSFVSYAGPPTLATAGWIRHISHLEIEAIANRICGPTAG